MENASKALIIAGAILLSIVLITLGVLIIGRGQEAVDQASIDDQVISAWNQKWTKFEGSNVSGTTVNTLIDQVLASNASSHSNGDTSKMIQIAPSQSSGISVTDPALKGCAVESKTVSNWGTKSVTTKAKPGSKYKVSTKLNGYGFICQIIIEL